ncbi:helix-turn-helix domain-containing protein [Variovorax sp. UC122_21]|uniref:helix-turn-helix domain-containing protein n=1 Tax=Variovorax TaxID=34072 RepID=UPI0019327034|nr:helix-turn-helix transcriptional regulator [Variovorax paradoxus]
MSAAVKLDSSSSSELLRQFGERLASVRRARGLTALSLSRELGISRTTLGAAERGEPTVTMGTYMRILAQLGMAADVALLAAQTNSASIERRHQRFAREVERGQRHPQTLFAFPAELVARAELEFPENAFGEPQPW